MNNIENKHKALTIEAKDGILSISIGIDILKFGVEVDETIRVIDSKKFAEDFVKECEIEDETGETLITKFLDGVSNRMVEYGRGENSTKYLG